MLTWLIIDRNAISADNVVFILLGKS